MTELLVAADSNVRVEGYLKKIDTSKLTAEWVTKLDDTSGRTVSLSAGDAAIGWQGRKVSFLIGGSDGKTWAEKIFSADPDELRQAQEVTEALKRDTFERGRIVTRGANELMPMMALWGQDGKFYLKKDFIGAPLVVNFIFTRCANPKMCPASTQCMKKLGDALESNAKLLAVKLITFTFDPAYDTPGVLKMYADGYKINSQRHYFLTGDNNQIKDLMRHYGILTTEADGTIVHNSAVIVVSPEGRIIQRHEGAVFDIKDMVTQLENLTELTKK